MDAHPRPAFSHKGSYGRVLVVCWFDRDGRALAALASEAALRAGAGLVTLAIPKRLNPIVEGLLPEVMTLTVTRNGCRELGSLGDRNHPRICGKKRNQYWQSVQGLSQHPENSVPRPSIDTRKTGNSGLIYGWLSMQMA